MKSFKFLFMLFVLISLTSCWKRDEKEKTTLGLEQEIDTEVFLAGVKSVPTLWPAEGKFSVETRQDKLKIQNCSECHVGKKLKRTVSEGLRKAHWDIKLRHADKQVMSCKTCHSVKDVSELKLLEGKSIGMNHAYKNCRQCHSPQAKDWAGGAHGKRVKTWAGRRIVYNCTGCHNPHKPKLEKRWPKINTTLPEGH